MIKLPDQFGRKMGALFVVSKHYGKWEVYLGPWYEVGNDGYLHNDIEFKTINDIAMNAKDLMRFSQQIKKHLSFKPYKKVYLDLSFRKNKPQFNIGIQFMTDETQPFFTKKEKGKFLFECSINAIYSVYKRLNKDFYYKNRFGYSPLSTLLYYPPAVLEQFAADLEREAAPYLKKKWWQFWK